MKPIFKKIYAFALAASLTISLATPTYADTNGMEKKLEGHWAKKVLQAQTVTEFFPELAKNNFAEFSPNKEISTAETRIALNLLYSKYQKRNLELTTKENKVLLRKDISLMLVPALEDKEKKLPKLMQKHLPYLDCQNFSRENTRLLSLLSEQGLLKGISPTLFAPEKTMSQSEVIILLQRVVERLEKKRLPKIETPVTDGIPFTLTKQVTIYDEINEGYSIQETNDQITLTITKKFSTAGYAIGIEKIIPSKTGLLVVLKVFPPEGLVAQVITYPTATIKILKSDIPKDTPLQFTINGLNRNDI